MLQQIEATRKEKELLRGQVLSVVPIKDMESEPLQQQQQQQLQQQHEQQLQSQEGVEAAADRTWQNNNKNNNNNNKNNNDNNNNDASNMADVEKDKVALDFFRAITEEENLTPKLKTGGLTQQEKKALRQQIEAIREKQDLLFEELLVADNIELPRVYFKG